VLGPLTWRKIIAPEPLQYASALERLVMRRYAVRFAVAVLTFGIGIALSLALGLFKPHQFHSDFVYVRRSSCSRQMRQVRPVLVTVDSEAGDPVKLIFLGSRPDRQLEFSLENQRDQVVSGYTLTGERMWTSHSAEGENTTFNFRSFEMLGPEESRTISLPPAAEGMKLRVGTVTFQSGFTWINSRDLK